jgi:hypothetical protein
MSVFTQKADMVRWTCQATSETNLKGDATDLWGSTAIEKIGRTQQHWWPWANGFVFRTVIMKPKGKHATKGCDRDEWPPHYFWPGDETAKKKRMVQRVRFIPYNENSGAGQIWKGFCENNAARSVGRERTYIKSEFIKTMGIPQSKQAVGKDKITSESIHFISS